MRTSAHTLRTVLAIAMLTLLGGAIRWLLLERTFPPGLAGDEEYYVQVAASIARGEGHTYRFAGAEFRAWRPPGHAFLLSTFLGRENALLPADHPLVLKPLLYLQLVLGTALVLLTGLLGWELFDPRTGVLAALATALYPTLIAFSLNLWSETLFAALLVTAFICASKVERGRSWLLVGATGAVFGLGLLTRQLALVAAVACCCWWLLTATSRSRPRALLQGAAMLVVAAAVAFPWTLRNYSVLGRFVPLGTVGWFAAAEGNTFVEAPWIHPRLRTLTPLRREYFSIPDEIDRTEFARRRALEAVRTEMPWWFVKKGIRTISILFSPDSYLFKKLSHGDYGVVPPWVLWLLVPLTVLCYLLASAWGTIGAALARERRLDSLACLLFSMLFAAHLLTTSSSRFRVPWTPLVIVFACSALARWHSRDRELPAWKIWLSAGMILVLVAWCLPIFLADARSLLTAGTYVDPVRPW